MLEWYTGADPFIGNILHLFKCELCGHPGNPLLVLFLLGTTLAAVVIAIRSERSANLAEKHREMLINALVATRRDLAAARRRKPSQ